MTRLAQLTAVWLTMAGLVIGAQWLTQAYRAEWTFHPDEPAHQHAAADQREIVVDH